MNITILTATYNRKDLLNNLCLSLSKQTSKKFEWVIIDDGSNDDTEKIVFNWNYNNIGFVIQYYKKENGGKSRAINFGLNKCLNSDFVLIVDDDEYLYPEAISTINSYAKKYYNTNCAGIDFLRNDKNQKVISNYIPRKDLIMSIQERNNKNLKIDGYTGYFIKKLGNKRFPEFVGEKYVGPGVLQMLVGKTYDFVWPCAVLGETEYLKGGLTNQGRKLRIQNPRGMIFYCNLLQDNKIRIHIRLKYSIMGYAYSIFIKDKFERKKILANTQFFKICYLIGKVLGIMWKIKFYR